jgi:putative transposase
LRVGNFVGRYSGDVFWALLASGQINMRKVDGWQSLATKAIDQPIDLAA